ncbi:MAG: hypothetical protein RLN88_14615 [Ekhidna sp.]|uniref:hypothetical protein n=1 Tax=Ekhidna sp. TaxID=2608089 RepID=UPI0032EDD19B
MIQSFKKPLLGLFIASMILMLGAYNSGYDQAIDWEVTTTGEVIEFPAWTLTTDLMTHEITGEKYLLTEQYSGSEITRNMLTDRVLLGLLWIAICMTLAASTYLKRYGFFASAALFALLINRLNLQEIGLFGVESKLIVFIPFVLLITPLVIFHEYKKSTPFLLRLGILLLLSSAILLGVDNSTLFTDHLIAHSLFSFAICALLFLFIISEEIIFSILYVVTSVKGGRSNHTHFLILSLIYLGDLTLYYLNKSGLFENSFFFFDPFILLVISALVALWSLRYKAEYLSRHIDPVVFFTITISLGIITFAFLAHQMIRGNDSVYQAFHYVILYFHLGFVAMFFLYIIGNFVDPLIKGFEVYKIAYKERNLPYASARLGGFIAVLAFYFLSGQEPYNLLKSGYYNYLSQAAKTEGNQLLANEYLLQSAYIGYNTHYANYSLGWVEAKKDNEYPAKTYFNNAAQRYPSPYAWINYGNLDSEINSSKVMAVYEEALRKESSGEMENNLALLRAEKGDLKTALEYFEKATPSDEWNEAPKVNKWCLLKRLEIIDSTALLEDYYEGNYGVKANILTTQLAENDLEFIYDGIAKVGHLHRQAYLLNSSFIFSHDSIESIIRREVEKSSDGVYNNRLRKALAIHLYKKGEVNEAFMMMDYLQANAHQFYKGEYLDALGKFALDQGAYKLSLEFFDLALEVKHHSSIFGKMEVMARMGNANQIPDVLLKFLKRNPEFTEQANLLLDKLEGYNAPSPKSKTVPDLTTLSNDDLLSLGRKNAFHEAQVIAVADELERREASGGYELLVDATEINPYSTPLLKKYVLVALDWNLLAYADQTLKRLQELLSKEEFEAFQKQYNQAKSVMEQEGW